MTVVAGVLFDHVDQDPAQGYALAVAGRLDRESVERYSRADNVARMVAFSTPGSERRLDVCASGAVEGAVTVIRRGVERRCILTGKSMPQPEALNIGHVTHQPQEREV